MPSPYALLDDANLSAIEARAAQILQAVGVEFSATRSAGGVGGRSDCYAGRSVRCASAGSGGHTGAG